MVMPPIAGQSYLQTRTGDIADATMDLLASQQAVWEDFTPAERLYLTTIDTTRDSAELVAGLVRFTSEGG